MTLPKYVEKDLEILYNYEFATDDWGKEINKKDKIAYKLYQIAQKYPQKHLEAIIEYLGYLDDSDIKLEEKDFRDEILHEAEYYFKEAMKDHFLMYTYREEEEQGDYHRWNRQIKFIDIGWLDCVYTSRESYIKRYKDVTRHPSKAIYLGL